MGRRDVGREIAARAKREAARSWYQITNWADEQRAEIRIYADIGEYDISAATLCAELDALDVAELDVRINSRGGDIFEGIAIHNALAAHPARVCVRVDGLAASIASVIAMAGDRVCMVDNSQLMIHEGHTVAVGAAQQMRQTADTLDRLSDTIAGFYAARAGGSAAGWRDRMRAETWYSADEAVAVGLADEVVSARPARSVASADLSPFRYAGRASAPAPDLTAPDVEAAPGSVVEPAREAMPEPAPVDAVTAPLQATAVGPHDTDVREGEWEKGANVGRLPSPLPLATVRAVFASYDEERVEDGQIIKDACHLPHHFVDADGKPGAASLSGVRNALARLGQVEDMSDSERDTARAHLRAHLNKQDSGSGDAAADDVWAALVGSLTASSGRDEVFAALMEAL